MIGGKSMSSGARGKEIIGGEIRVGGGTMPLSKAVRTGDYVHLSGQIAFRPDGSVLSGDIETETRAVLDIISATLEEAGCTLADVIKTTVWLSDARDFSRFNAVYAEYFPTEPPARSTIRAELLLDVKVEIEAIAYRPQDD